MVTIGLAYHLGITLLFVSDLTLCVGDERVVTLDVVLDMANLALCAIE
jgi:hypothetical protein